VKSEALAWDFPRKNFFYVYLELGKQLANAKYMAADATPTRVNEVNQAMEKRNLWTKNQWIGPPEPLPWEMFWINCFKKVRFRPMNSISNAIIPVRIM
jgi:hypothetical protein